MTTAWLNPNLYRNDSDNYRDLMTATDKELLAVGATRTNKTLLCLRKQMGLHFRHQGFKSAIVRSEAVDLHDSIREDIKTLSRYPLGDPRCPIKAEGGTHFHTLHINGGRLVLGGMNRPGRVLGTQYDLIFYSQAEQSTHEHLQILKTRVAGTAGNWKDASGKVLSQLLMDANPEGSDHYLLEREKGGLLRFINFVFTDNPLFFRKNRWSKTGKDFVEDIDRSLEGVYHDRLFKGIWADPEGAVFEIRSEHIVDTLPEADDYLWYNAMDFGMTEPNVCLWIGEHARTGDVIVAKEFRHTGLDIIEFGKRVRDARRHDDRRILKTIIDNDENRQKLLYKHCRITSEMARKGAGSIQDGMNLIQQALRCTAEGQDGGLRFYSGLRDGFSPDPKLVRDHKPLDTITEMRNLQFKPPHLRTGAPSDDLPMGRDKHGIDGLRYWFLWRSDRSRSIGSGRVIHGRVGGSRRY